jgi:CheY-like chemotaxis protein
MGSILVIDDDRAVLATIQLLLERDGHAVTICEDGSKGLQQLKAQPFDLIIVDIFMPNMDGLETMSLVHRHRPSMPIIVISGRDFQSASYPPPDFLRMATKLGAVSGLRKPFRPRDLLDSVHKCLAGEKSLAS